MAVDFDYELDENVRIGGREMPLRKALLEYMRDAAQFDQSESAPPEWERAPGKQPSALRPDHMRAIAQTIPVEDLNASNDE